MQQATPLVRHGLCHFLTSACENPIKMDAAARQTRCRNLVHPSAEGCCRGVAVFPARGCQPSAESASVQRDSRI